LFTNERDNGADFCESYKSQILNENVKKQESSFSIILKILTILMLLTIIVAVSLYGYNYFMNGKKSINSDLPPVSMQIPDEELKITEEPLVSTVKNVSNSEGADMNEIANNVKIAISDSESEEKNKEDKLMIKEEKKLEIPLSAPEAKYLEELADLSREIDKERK